MKTAGYILVMVICALGVYPSLDAGFVSDDFILIEKAMDSRIVDDLFTNWLGEQGEGGFYRPVVDWFWVLDYRLHGLSARGYHLTNILLHLAVTWMAVRLVHRLSRRFVPGLIAGLIFGLHPCHTEAVAWVSGRTDLIASFFYLGSILLFLKESRRNWLRSLYFVVSLACAVLAMMSKELAFTLPLMMIAIDWMDRSSSTQDSGRRRSIWPFFPAAAAVLILRYLSIGEWIGGYGASSHLRFDRHILIYLNHYTNWLIVPLQVGFKTGSGAWHFVLAVFGFLGLVSIGSGKLRAGPIWSIITVLPVMSICRPQYLYLPSIGFAWLIADLVYRGYERKPGVLRAAAGFIVVVGLGVSYYTALSSQISEWEHTGGIAEETGNILMSHHPELPDHSHVIFVSPPVNTRIPIGVFQNGVQSAVRLWYGNFTLTAEVVPDVSCIKASVGRKDFVFRFFRDNVYELTDRIDHPDPSQVRKDLIDETFILSGSDSSRLVPAGGTASSGIRLVSMMANSAWVEQGRDVARMTVEFDTGEQQTYILKAGRDTAEWAIDREDVRLTARHKKAPIAYSFFTLSSQPVRVPAHTYETYVSWDNPQNMKSVRIDFLLAGSGPEGQHPAIEIRELTSIDRK